MLDRTIEDGSGTDAGMTTLTSSPDQVQVYVPDTSPRLLNV